MDKDTSCNNSLLVYTDKKEKWCYAEYVDCIVCTNRQEMSDM